MIAVIGFDGTCYALTRKNDLPLYKDVLDQNEVLYVEVNDLESLQREMNRQTQMQVFGSDE